MNAVKNKTSESVFYNPFVKNETDLDLLFGEETKAFFMSKNLDNFFSKIKNGKVFIYFLKVVFLNENKELVTIYIGDCQNAMGIKSPKTVREGLEELVQYGVIKKRKGSEYWINPFMVFFGNRCQYFRTAYKEYCRDKFPQLFVKYFLK